MPYSRALFLIDVLRRKLNHKTCNDWEGNRVDYNRDIDSSFQDVGAPFNQLKNINLCVELKKRFPFFLLLLNVLNIVLK